LSVKYLLVLAWILDTIALQTGSLTLSTLKQGAGRPNILIVILRIICNIRVKMPLLNTYDSS